MKRFYLRKALHMMLAFFSLCTIFAQPVKHKKFFDNLKQTNKNVSDQILRVENLIENSKDKIFNIEAFIFLGESYNYLECYEKAYLLYLKALDIAEKNDEWNFIGVINERLANIQFHLGNYKKSINYYNVSEKCFLKTKNTEGLLRTKGNMALVDIKLGKFDKGLAILFEINKSPNLSPNSLYTSNLAIGDVYFYKNDFENAIKYYKNCIPIIDKIKTKETLFTLVYQNLAEAFLNQRQYDKALYYNEKSEVELKKFKSNELMSFLNLLYSKIFKAKGEYEKAYKYLQLHQEFEQKFKEENNISKIDNMEIVNKIENQKKELVIKNQKIKILNQEKLVQKIKMGLALLMVLFCILILIKKQKGKIKKINDELLDKESKLEFNISRTDKIVLEMAKNNQFMEHFKESLIDLKKNEQNNLIKEKINKLILDINTFSLTDYKKKNLLEVDTNFLYNLKSKYPTLNQEEIEVCVLIYLNLKNKEIAQILNLSIRSIENTRYRIRKKMSLPQKESLFEAISKT